MQCGTVRMTQGESRFKDLVSSIDVLEASFESTLRHLIIKRPPQLNRENVSSIDWMTAVRGAERYGLVVGPPAAGEHLPAMLRIRGWLNSSHQTTRIDLIAAHPTLVVNDQTNEHPQKADWIQYSDVINGLADDLLDRVTLVTRHKDGLASVSVLQKTHLEQGLLSVTAAKIDSNHPLRTHFSIE